MVNLSSPKKSALLRSFFVLALLYSSFSLAQNSARANSVNAEIIEQQELEGIELESVLSEGVIDKLPPLDIDGLINTESESNRVESLFDESAQGGNTLTSPDSSEADEQRSVEIAFKQVAGQLNLLLNYNFQKSGASDSSADAQAAPNPATGAARVVLLKEGMKRVDWLEKTGARGLAASVLQEQRPHISETASWIEWEKRLWSNLKRRREWKQIVQRVKVIENIENSGTELLPSKFLFETRNIGIEAMMQQRKYSLARQALRKLLLSKDLTVKSRATVRRKIFLTYLWEGKLGDADIAMQRYQQDYFPDDQKWNILRARVLIQTQQYTRAVSQLASASSKEARLVRLYARLMDGSITANEVIDKASEIDPKVLQNEQQIERWSIIAAAAKAANLPQIQVKALENSLALPVNRRDRPIVAGTEQDLLEAYAEFGLRLGNGAHLLIGDFENWIQYAHQRIDESGIEARAIYVYIARSSGLSSLIEGAWSNFADSLRKDNLTLLIYRLFGESKAIGDYGLIRGEIAIELSEDALRSGNMTRAAALTSGINQPPDGTSWLDWQLRQARLNVYASNIDQGVAILDAVFAALRDASEEEIDRILQIIFDLQTLGKHQQTIPFLEQLLSMSRSTRQQREILFWLAESLQDVAEFERAALLFLRSSTMTSGGDLWSQTAKYRAAGALVDAKLVDDARVIYKKLLATTQEPQRREQLTRKIQDLWLIEARDSVESD